jgi:hypothetical protein
MRDLLPAVLILAFLALPAAADDESGLADPGPTWKRLRAADQLVQKGDLEGLYRAVVAAGERGTAEDVDVLSTLPLDAINPLVRFLYGLGLEKAGVEKSIPVLAEKIRKGKGEQKIRGLEILGFLKHPEAIEPLFEAAASKDRFVATEAFRGLARQLPKKEVRRLVDVVIAVNSEKAALRGAWAIADIQRSPKRAASSFGKIARLKTADGDRAKAIISDLTATGIDQTFRYPKHHLIGIESWFTKRKPTIQLEGAPLARQNLQKTLDFLKEKAPEYHQLVLRAFNTISSRSGKDPLNWTTRTLDLQPSTAANWEPHQLSTILVRGATLMLLRDVGDVHWMRRGFEQAGKNTYWYTQNRSGYKLDDDLAKFCDHLIRRKLWR